MYFLVNTTSRVSCSSIVSESGLLSLCGRYFGNLGNSQQNNHDGYRALQLRGKLRIFDFCVNCPLKLSSYVLTLLLKDEDNFAFWSPIMKLIKLVITTK